MKIKTMLLWTAKGCRKPKVLGSASSTCSAATIAQFRRMAAVGKGRFWIVTETTADGARNLIRVWKGATLAQRAALFQDGYGATYDNGRTVALGIDAVRAVRAAERSCARWDDRIRTQGRVTEKQSRALGGADDHGGDRPRKQCQ